MQWLKNITKNKYLIIGLILSLLFHSIVFASFWYLQKHKKKPEKEKPITITLIEPQKKVSKSKKSKIISHKKHRKKIKRKPHKIKKLKQKVIKKPKLKPMQKPIHKKIEKLKEKPKKTPEKIVKKSKKVVPKPKKTEEKIIKKVPKKEIKTISTPPKPVKKTLPSKIVKEEKPRELTIPDLSDITKKKKEQEKKINDYLKYIKREFERNKFYPYRAKKLGIEGTVIIKFVVLPDGKIDKNSIQIIEADHPILARGAKRIFEKITKLPPTPNGKKMTIEIPIEYILYELY